MILEVRWTQEAEETFDAIMLLIQNGWGDLAAEKFRIKTLRALRAMSQHPLIFPESGIDSVRKAVITRQTTVFYEVLADHISLVFFWDNRQDPLFEN